jgi:MYXO-CTERM domain-containing protein
MPIRGSDGKARMVRMGTWGPGAAVSARPAASPQPAARPQFAGWKKPSEVPSGWPGWLVLAGLAAAVAAWRRKRSRS